MFRFAVRRLWLGWMLLSAGVACAQTYPDKPIRILAPEVATSIDFVLRLIAGPLGDSLGQRMVIENRGVIGVEIVARAPSDGYTLICYTNPMWLTPLFRDTSWDPLKDFSPITLMVSSPSVLVVHPALPVKSVQELIALARAKPKELNYASGSTGSATHIGAELFKAMARVDMVRINYKGTGGAISDLMTGQVQVMFPSAGAAMQHVKAGRLRALAVASAEPSALTPGLQTVAASAGLPGYDSRTLTALFAPAKTPGAIITRLNQEFVRALNRPEVKEKLFNNAIEVVANSPEQLTATIKSEMATIGKVVREAGLRE